MSNTERRQMTATDAVITDPMIRVRKLRKAFAEKLVLDDLDLDIGRGESLVVIGGSGTGKSVLIKNMIGIMRPDSGSIVVLDDLLLHASHPNSDGRDRWSWILTFACAGGAA